MQIRFVVGRIVGLVRLLGFNMLCVASQNSLQCPVTPGGSLREVRELIESNNFANRDRASREDSAHTRPI